MTENALEQLALTWFQDSGWEYRHGPGIAPDGETPERTDYRQVVLTDRLQEALRRLNPGVPEAVLDDVLHRVTKLHEPSLVQSNRRFHEALVDGLPIEIDQDGVKRGDRVRLIDFEHPERNRFLVVNQFTVLGSKQPRRPDLVCFINGLPIAVIELKNLADEQADIWLAFNQLETYKAEMADLFVFNEALVISDGLNARVGSLTASRERFLPWRTIRNENDRPLLQYELEKVVRGFFAPDLLLDYLRYFVLFEQGDDGLVKKIAGYHQFHAVREAVRVAVIAATQAPAAKTAQEERATYGKRVEPGSRKGGIVWHTQGSGKSLSMVFFAAKLMQRPEMQNPTIVVVTDRNDLDGQLFQTFMGARSLLKEAPRQAEDREQLRALLAGRPSGGIIFSTVQKFSPGEDEERFPRLTDRANIVVIADEAHRSQYGFRAVLDKKSGQYKYGFAKHLRDALPNATFVGFTGTPVETDDKDTRAVFGDYVSVYDIQDAVDDGATVPIYYESRLAKLDINQAEIEALSDQVEEIFEDEESIALREAAKTQWAALEKLVGAAPRIQEVAADLVKHFEARVAAVDGKAMVVAMSRQNQAIKGVIAKATETDKKLSQDRNNAVLKQILDNAVVAEGVEDVFKLAGLERPDIGVLSDAFLEEVRQLPQRNLAVELLQKLLNDEIKSRSRTNVVLEKKFSERLQAALSRYRNRAIESAQVIEELIAMAKEFREAARRGENLGLNESELAFYDALANNESAVRELGDEVLKKIAAELTEKLRNSTSVDWQKRESVRARLRNLVRITLRRYKYPPDKQEDAIRLVLEQAERLSDEWTK